MFDIGLFGPFSVKQRRGNSIRIKLQAEGLLKNNFSNFCMYSYEVDNNKKKYNQKEIGKYIYPKIFPLFQKINKLPCKIAHVHHCIGAMLLNQKYILDMPSYMTLQTNEIYKNEGMFLKRILLRKCVIPYFLKNIEKGAINNAVRVIVASESIKNDILKNMNIDKSKIIIITNPVDISKYKISKKEELIVGVSASNFTDNMDRACLDITTMIAKKLPNVKFYLAGYMSNAQKKILMEIKNIKIFGQLNHLEYINFLENISVFLNPYMSFWDYGGSKFKLLEAAAAGIPVISTTNGAIGFPDKDALFIGDNIDEITTHINQLKNKELRISKGTFLRNIIIEKHDYINEAKKLIEIYNEVLD